MSEQIRGIILEGQSCAGKTSIFSALKKYHVMQNNAESVAERNVIFLGEHYSQTLNLVNGSFYRMTRSENLKVLNERIQMLEQLNDYANSMGVHSRRSRGLLFVFERFHLNYAAAHNDIDSAEYRQIESRLRNLNAHTYLLTISDENIISRFRHREPEKYKVLTTEVSDEINLYRFTNERLIEIADKSMVKTKIINTDDMNWDEYAKQIFADIE